MLIWSSRNISYYDRIENSLFDCKKNSRHIYSVYNMLKYKYKCVTMWGWVNNAIIIVCRSIPLTYSWTLTSVRFSPLPISPFCCPIDFLHFCLKWILFSILFSFRREFISINPNLAGTERDQNGWRVKLLQAWFSAAHKTSPQQASAT